MTRRTQDGYEDKFGEYQPLLPREWFNKRVLAEVEQEEKEEGTGGVPLEDWEGQIEITGKDAFGETAIISPQMDDPNRHSGRNYANRCFSMLAGYSRQAL